MNRQIYPLMLVLLLLALALPAMAQETEDGLVIASGEYTIDEDGNIVVDGYVIAPASAFIPAGYAEGDMVVITGYLLPDGMTIQALSIEPFEEEELEDPEEEPVDDEEPVDEEPVDEEPIDEEPVDETETEDPEDEEVVEEEVGVFCASDSGYHPAGIGLATEFGVAYGDVMALHCGGMGFGEIMIAYSLAEASGEDVALFLEMREAGSGWGQIMIQSGMHPAQVMGRRGLGRGPWANDDVDETESDTEASATRQRGPNNGGNNGPRVGPPPNAGPPPHAGPPVNRGGGNGRGGGRP
jgi:hypothetical protein